MEPIRIPSDLCVCEHWREDHEIMCVVGDCECIDFTPNDGDDWGNSFTDDEGHKLEGRA
jgi:hypothetical protein